ncbi:MAG: hypothetical protein JXR80_10595, partial [Deltaproteobacteria bacterium]|nr:hypothetical protein [Deltaproteobacteria bacterium]
MSDHSLRSETLIVGLGVSGLAAARLLKLKGWSVAGSDQRSAADLSQVLATLAALGISEVESGGHSESFFLGR